MKAFVKTERKFGAVELIDVPKPEPKGDQVLFFASDFSPLLQNFFPSMRVGNFIHSAA